jgi:hypothetical protein
MVTDVQDAILWILSLAVLGMGVVAALDAARHRADAFTAAGKLTKTKWLLINAVAAALAFLCLPTRYTGLPSMFAVASAVASGVYLADVRPALRRVTGRGGSRGNGYGPYGPW